jgi:hypothetical protein
MPRLDINGFMVGSAESCENRSAGASMHGMALDTAWRCGGAKQAFIEELWAQTGPTGEQRPGVHNRLDEHPREPSGRTRGAWGVGEKQESRGDE